MKIDFHTHIFPDALAEKAVDSMQRGLKAVSGKGLPVFSDATKSGLYTSMEKSEIDLCVALPVATSAKQTETINNFAKRVTDGNIISFGSVFPGAPDSLKWLERLAKEGFLGIKLHPEYQGANIHSREMIDIINKCYDLGLVVVIHTGVDFGIEPPVHCTPEQMRKALNYFDGNNVVAAHLGGFMMWDDVEKYLVGTNLILDTSMLSRFMNKEQCARIIRSHGFDKTVCGSDSPWEDLGDNRKFLTECGLALDEIGQMDNTAKKLLRL
ncbi:MAG: amidohydrolase family protein [Oscillospiraceae bacterium]|nr:amidohydrolase family protein [Oscillospiraceae bacterium]